MAQNINPVMGISSPGGVTGISNVSGDLILAPSGSITLTPGDDTVTLSGGQLGFPATQNASADANTLDDYEEGTWTPVFSFVVAGDLSVVYQRQVGTYVKIGRLVKLQVQIRTSTFTHTTASNNGQITGIPFTHEGVSWSNSMGSLIWEGVTKAGYTQLNLQVTTNSTTMLLIASGSGQANATVVPADMPSAGTVQFVSALTYRAAA